MQQLKGAVEDGKIGFRNSLILKLPEALNLLHAYSVHGGTCSLRLNVVGGCCPLAELIDSCVCC